MEIKRIGKYISDRYFLLDGVYPFEKQRRLGDRGE